MLARNQFQDGPIQKVSDSDADLLFRTSCRYGPTKSNQRNELIPITSGTGSLLYQHNILYL